MLTEQNRAQCDPVDLHMVWLQAEVDAAAALGAPLPLDTLALAVQPLPQLGRLPELMPLRLLAHNSSRSMQQPLMHLAVSAGCVKGS